MTAPARVRPRRPQRVLPVPLPAEVRRTSSVDVRRVPADGGGFSLDLAAVARDELRTRDGLCTLDRAEVRAQVRGGCVHALSGSPGAALPGLVGLPIRAGFRAAAREAVSATGCSPFSPLALLLDDLPVAVLVSGYIDLQAGRSPAGEPGRGMRDVCAGWRTGGTPMGAVDLGMPVPVPELTQEPTQLSWPEPLPPLSDGVLRRRRWVVIRSGAEPAVEAGFRDSCRDEQGTEGVLHEYALTCRLDAQGLLRDLRAEARVLPYPECPSAADQVSRLDGAPADELGRVVPALLDGTSSCTHLNDLLRALSSLRHLAGLRSAVVPGAVA